VLAAGVVAEGAGETVAVVAPAKDGRIDFTDDRRPAPRRV
jgi:hypothetical protein